MKSHKKLKSKVSRTQKFQDSSNVSVRQFQDIVNLRVS